MKKAWNKLREKNGSALIFGVIMLFFLTMITAVSMTYIESKSTAAYLQETAESVLDTYTVTQGRAAAASFKNGSDYTVTLDKDMYVKRLREKLGIGTDNTGKTNGRVRFILSDITLDYTAHNEIDSTVSMHIQIPVYFANVKVSEVSGNMTVRSKYAKK